MTRILFVDDDLKRCREFAEGRSNAPIVCHTADGAIATLRAVGRLISEVWLDHDLGRAVGEDQDSPTSGSEIVRKIVAEKLVPKSTEIIVHSLNGMAALSMIKALRGAGWLNTRYQPWGTERNAERDRYVDAAVSGSAPEFELPGIPIIGGRL